MEICKFCNAVMLGEQETLPNSNHFRFFYSCPKCKAVYEGEKKQKGSHIQFSKTRWYNPQTKEMEEWQVTP